MRIGKQDHAFTAIATSDATSVTVRGHDLCDELIGKINFTDYFWLLVLGDKPTEAQRDMMDACLVAIAEHGLVPSVQAARMTLAAGPDAWQGAMSAGLLGMGSVVAGSSESAGRYLAEVIAKAEADGTDIETAAIASLKEHKALRRKVAGLGHPQHSGGDPRADRLLAIADDLGISGKYIETCASSASTRRGSSGGPCRSMSRARSRPASSTRAGRSKPSRRCRSWHARQACRRISTRNPCAPSGSSCPTRRTRPSPMTARHLPNLPTRRSDP
jgi:hypothetical protein